MFPPDTPFPYRGVSLDIDGTLYSLAWFKFHLVNNRLGDLHTWIVMGKARTEIRNARLSSPNMHAMIIERMAAELKRPTQDVNADVQRMLDEDWPWLLSKVGLYRHVLEMLHALERAKIPVVLNSDYPGERKAAGLGLADYPFRAILDATTFGALKPRNEVFQAAVETLQLPAHDVVHVGDSLLLDIPGAGSVGMDTVLVGKGKDKLPEECAYSPTWSFASMPVFAREVVQRINKGIDEVDVQDTTQV